MAAEESLSAHQFVKVSELRNMYSADFDSPVHQTLGHLRRSYREDQAEAVHPRDALHGGPDKYIAHLSKDIKENGVREPLTVRNGNVLVEGHHRAVAAMQLGLDEVPVRHIQ